MKFKKYKYKKSFFWQGILQPPPPPSPPPPPPLPLSTFHPSSFFQTPVGESVWVSCPEEVLDVGQQLSGEAQQLVVPTVQIISSAASSEEDN